jgi:hypothetical protein
MRIGLRKVLNCFARKLGSVWDSRVAIGAIEHPEYERAEK